MRKIIPTLTVYAMCVMLYRLGKLDNIIQQKDDIIRTQIDIIQERNKIIREKDDIIKGCISRMAGALSK